MFTTVIAPPTISFLSALVVQLTIVMMAAASFAYFLAIMTTVTLLACKLQHDALNTNIALHVHAHDNNDAGWKLIFAVDDAMMPLASSSESPSNGSRAVSASKVRIEAKTKQSTTTRYVGPSFVEYRDPQPECEDDDDESANASTPPPPPPAAATETIDPEGPVDEDSISKAWKMMVASAMASGKLQPTGKQNLLAPTTTSNNSESSSSSPKDSHKGKSNDDMEELLVKFSKLTLGDNTSKTAKNNDDSMEELVDSFATKL